MVSQILLNIYHLISTIIGITTAVIFPFMCYLFLYKSKPEMSTFRWYLLVNACWVYFYTLLVAFLQPVPVLSNFGLIITGFAAVKLVSLPFLFSFMEFGYFCLTAQIYSSQALFFYRYSLMVNNLIIRKTLQTKFAIPFNLFSTLFFGLSMTLPSTLTRVSLREISFNESIKMEKAMLWYLANKKEAAVLTFNNTGSPMIFIFNIIAIFFSLYATTTIIYCAVKIRQYVFASQDRRVTVSIRIFDYLYIKGPCFCPKARKLRRIFLYTLAVNLFAVLISLLLPVIVCFLIPIIFKFSFADDLVILGFIWSMTHPIINFSLTVIYVSPYREAVKKLLISVEAKYCYIFKKFRFGKIEEAVNVKIQSKILSSKVTTTHNLCHEPGKNINHVK